ncbi:pilus assembly protein N-terminal domain-containing protein [Burkholderiaceae bacterium FT117]|uniref:type II and III secretion system protein family protein n=1 Tax=Zeimonas sediminis TaxID=2944268 RepID=UPI002342C60B|nr:pilus assembly protein N-terminal domain-containing protein [Zeimonas sediminis]MCM5572017.1 pilus assembly protein N-terminal domain-containing protein [Zeimonas sediminis]
MTLAIAGPIQGTAQPVTENLELYVGEVRVLEVGELRRIAIGNGKVLQASALDRGQLLIIPEAPGQSALYLWGKDGAERHLSISVVPADASRLLGEVRAMLGDTPGVVPKIVGDKVVVEGSGVSEEQAARIAEVAGRYPQIVNLVSRVGRERMIEMDVRMVEIRRDAMQNLGVKWSASAQGPSFGLIGDLHRSAAFRTGGAAAEAGLDVRSRIAPFATTLGIATSIGSMINLMVQNGDAVVLAEPRLACRSGGSARFVAGGELPIPQTSGLGATSVAFREYGVKFDVSPVASESGVIAAKIATEISAVDFEVLVQDVPGLLKRRAETEVNLRENETLVIAGLLAEETSRSIDRVPGLGELPILGPLFRSRNFRDRRSDLVVFITPRFVGADSPSNLAEIARSAERLERARETVRMAD